MPSVCVAAIPPMLATIGIRTAAYTISLRTFSNMLIDAAAAIAVIRLIESHNNLFSIDFRGDAKISSSIWAKPLKSCSTSSAAISILQFDSYLIG